MLPEIRVGDPIRREAHASAPALGYTVLHGSVVVES